MSVYFSNTLHQQVTRGSLVQGHLGHCKVFCWWTLDDILSPHNCNPQFKKLCEFSWIHSMYLTWIYFSEVRNIDKPGTQNFNWRLSWFGNENEWTWDLTLHCQIKEEILEVIYGFVVQICNNDSNITSGMWHLFPELKTMVIYCISTATLGTIIMGIFIHNLSHWTDWNWLKFYMYMYFRPSKTTEHFGILVEIFIT